MSDSPRYDGTEIALIGMAGRFPGARDTAELWRNLRDGVDAARRLTDAELAILGVPAARRADPRYVPVTAQLPDLDCFDAPFFGVGDEDAATLDPQQRIWLELAWAALESAGYDPEAGQRSIGVFAGASLSTYLLFNLAASLSPGASTDARELEILTGNSGDSIATRISYKLNLKGPSFTVQSACSTSLVAVHQACASLQNGECDLALAGAVSVKVNLLAGYLCHGGGVLSAAGRCSAFDAGADGMFFGNGGGVVVLKRLDDALADGDTVRAVIRGSAINNDGKLKVGYSAPAVEGQAEVLTEAWSAAGIDPATLSYFEAHGTGTPMGDTIEVKALTRAMQPHSPRRGFAALGAIKTSIGHLDVASGVAGLVKTVLALEHRQIPPSLHFAQASPEIDFAASPVRPATRLADWPSPPGVPRRAGVSSFGLGGTNAHVVVEEAPAPRAAPSRVWDLLTLSARDAAALERATDALAAHLDGHPAQELSDVAFTLQTGRRRFEHRRVLVCRPGASAAAETPALPATPQTPEPDAADLLRRRDPRRVFTLAEEAGERAVVFLLPGQADLQPATGGALYRDEAVFRREVDRCAELLGPRLGRDVIRTHPAFQPAGGGMAAPGGAADAAAAFTLQYALARLFLSWGVRPAAVTGVGAGEQAAACLAGTLSLDAALLRAVEPPAEGRHAEEAFAEIWRRPGRAVLELGGGRLGSRAVEHPDAPTGAAHLLVTVDGVAHPRGAAAVTALAQLWLLGVRPDWAAFHAGEARRRVPLPTYPFERRRYWIDAPGVPRPLSALDAAGSATILP